MNKEMTQLKHYDVLSNAKLISAMSEKDVADGSAISLDASKALAMSKDAIKNAKHGKPLSEDEVNSLAFAYAYSREAEAFFKAKNDDIKNAVKTSLELNDQLEAKSTAIDVKFAISKPSTTIEYDIDGLKSKRPDIAKQVLKKAGRPMKKADRKKIEDEIELLQKQLADLQKEIVEDDAKKQEFFNEDLFNSLLEEDDTLSDFKTIVVKERKFYFKESK